MDNAEDMTVSGVLQPIPPRLLLVAPADRQLSDQPNFTPGNGPVPEGKSYHTVAARSQGVDQLLQRWFGEYAVCKPSHSLIGILP
jgi:hypothetical protein